MSLQRSSSHNSRAIFDAESCFFSSQNVNNPKYPRQSPRQMGIRSDQLRNSAETEIDRHAHCRPEQSTFEDRHHRHSAMQVIPLSIFYHHQVCEAIIADDEFEELKEHHGLTRW
jgi:hypothetical protein